MKIQQQEQPRKKNSPVRETLMNLMSGTFSGVATAGLLSPWDRALYLATKHDRPFLSMTNFASPYHGFGHAIFQRTFSGSFYYLAQNGVRFSLNSEFIEQYGMDELSKQAVIGLGAGAINGLANSPLTVIKYKMWGKDNSSFMGTMRHMIKYGRWPDFFKGTTDILARDTSFGLTYELGRQLIKQHWDFEFGTNLVAASLATAISSPFNYTRNMKYAVLVGQIPPSMWQSLTELWRESGLASSEYKYGRLLHLQRRLCLGWGAARVGFGMALGQTLFDQIKQEMIKQDRINIAADSWPYYKWFAVGGLVGLADITFNQPLITATLYAHKGELKQHLNRQSLYKGFRGSAGCMIPATALMFGIPHALQNHLSDWYTALLAGAATASIVTVQEHTLTHMTQNTKKNNSFSATMSVIRAETNLWRLVSTGYFSTMMRFTISTASFKMISPTAYHYLCSQGYSPSAAYVFSCLASGLLGAITSQAFDRIKFIQQSNTAQKLSVWSATKSIHKTGGYANFFKASGSRLLRVASAVTICSAVNLWLEEASETEGHQRSFGN